MDKEGLKYRWVILLIACFAIFSPNYTQYQLAALAPRLIQSLSLSTSEFSSIFSAPMIPAIFFSLAAGILADKFGVKRVISIGLCISAAATCYRLFAADYPALFASMLFSGFGGCFLNANGAKIIGSWFPPEKVPSIMGILLAASTLAMTVGIGTTALLPGITSAYMIAAVISVAAMLLWLLLMKNPVAAQEKEAIPSASITISLKAVIGCRPVWLVGFSLMFTLAGNVIISSFLPTALGSRGIDAVTAGGFASVVTIGSMIGCLLAPAIAAKTGKIKPFLLLLTILSTVFTAFAWQVPRGILLGTALFLAGASMGGLIPILMSIPIQLPEIGPVYAGTAGGFVATLQLFGAVVIPSYVITPISGDNFNLLFMLGGICFAFIAPICLFLPKLGIDDKVNSYLEK